MPSHFDIRTLSMISGIISLALAICMVYVSRQRKTYAGFTRWTLGAILLCFGQLLLSMRGILPDFLTIVMANTLIAASGGCTAYGIAEFFGSPRRGWLLALPAGLTFLSFIHFTYATPNVNIRIIIISALHGLVLAYSGYLVHRHVPRLMRSRNLLLTAAFGVQAAWFGIRILLTLFLEGRILDFMRASALQGFSFVVLAAGSICVIIGLLVLNYQRIEMDLRAAMEEVKTLRGILPICASCKKIRDDTGIWNQIETYIRDRSEAEFTHGLCPECVKIHYPELEGEALE